MAEIPRQTRALDGAGTIAIGNNEDFTSIVTAGPWPDFPPIHLATSSMFGTVAETTSRRTELRVFMREMITSRVLPRVSFNM